MVLVAVKAVAVKWAHSKHFDLLVAARRAAMAELDERADLCV